MNKKDNYTYEEYFGKTQGKDEVNDESYQKEVVKLLNETTDSIKKQEMIEMVKEQHPKSLHFCLTEGGQCKCPYLEDIKREYKK